MEEDVLGTRQEFLRNRYVQCTHCKRWVPRDKATLIPPEEAITTDEFSPSEEVFLCNECRIEAQREEEEND